GRQRGQARRKSPTRGKTGNYWEKLIPGRIRPAKNPMPSARAKGAKSGYVTGLERDTLGRVCGRVSPALKSWAVCFPLQGWATKSRRSFFHASVRACPAGTLESSPAIYRWGLKALEPFPAPAGAEEGDAVAA